MTASEIGVSVLTASYAHREDHVRSTYTNLCRQTVKWEWVIQVDGEESQRGLQTSWLPTDDRISVEFNSEQLGTATTRNIGLTRCRGRYVQNLDCDDMLIGSALDDLALALDGNPDCVLAFGRDLEVHADGQQDKYQGGLDVGIVPPGLVYERWTDMPFPPIHPAGIMWRKSALLAYGGWAALRNGEDTAILVAATVHHPCCFIDSETLWYRLHPGQFSKDVRFSKWEDAKRTFIHDRVAALQASGPLWALPVDDPTDRAGSARGSVSRSA